MTQPDLLSWVPYVKGSDTSRAAAESIVPHVSTIEGEIRVLLITLGGCTCDEIEVETGLPHQTASARLKGLSDKGLIRDSGARRKTRSGRAARVYIAT
jgi:predicted ArsR family transcriptional regulator